MQIKYRVLHTGCLILVLFSLINSLNSQYAETITSGRPGQAIGARTLGRRVFQIQSGMFFNRINNGGKTNVNIFSNVIRLGVAEHFELNGVLNWQQREFTDGTAVGGLSDTQLGGRIHLIKHSGWIPSLDVQARLLLTWQSEVFQRERMGSSFIVATGNQITDRFLLTTNWGLLLEGNGSSGKASFVVNGNYAATKRLGVFAEVYGGFYDFTTFFDGGLSYLVTDDFQLDVSLGWQGQNNVEDWFIDFGISIRTDWREKD